MGGYNSGGGRGALKDNAFWRLDIARLKRIGALRPGTHPIHWSGRDGEKVANISITTEADRLTLEYRKRWRGSGDWEEVREIVKLDWTAQKLGGKRVWFLCPGCGSRRGVLYGRDGYRCRACHRMTYTSQYDAYPQLPWTRCHRVRARFGAAEGLAYPFPDRPKGMHRKTYNRLKAEDERANALLDQALYMSLGQLKASLRDSRMR